MRSQPPPPRPAIDRPRVVLGTRSTPLALAQTEIVARHLRASGYQVEIEHVITAGDRSLGGNLTLERGMFTSALDRALLDGTIDIAVHSLKDLPVESEDEQQAAAASAVTIAVIEREHPGDVLLWRGGDGSEPAGGQVPSCPLSSLATRAPPPVAASQAFAVLAEDAVVGTSSPRRQAAALAQRASLLCCAARGGVERRVERLAAGALDALILAEAGLVRLLRAGVAPPRWQRIRAARLSLDSWPAAPGQGALAVQVRAGGPWHSNPALLALEHPPTRRAVTLERAVLELLGGGCQLAAGATVAAAAEGHSVDTHGDSAVQPGAAAGDSARLVIALTEEAWRERAEVASPPAQRTIVLPLDNLAALTTESQRRALADHLESARKSLRPTLETDTAPHVVLLPPDGAAPQLEASVDAADLVVTSSHAATLRLASMLASTGRPPASIAAFEVVDPVPLDAPWPQQSLDLSGPRSTWPWVLVSSPNAARVLVERSRREPHWLRLPWCALGGGTARTLLALGAPANLVGRSRNVEHFAAFALEHLPPEAPVFLPQSRRARRLLARRLAEAGRQVVAWDAYTVAPRPGLRWPGAAPSVVLFTAPSTAQAWAEAGLPHPVRCAWSMGESTSRTLRELGFEAVAEAPEPSPAGVRALWEQLHLT